MASDPRVPIVGIGASAGGIEAFRGFFEHMPTGSGMGFVVVLHLAPERASMLADIIGRWTKMPVRQASDGDRIEAEHVYVVPPGSILSVVDGRVRLEALDGNRFQVAPIDVFLSSLGADLGELAFGVVLSGTGSDGSLGLKAIKECGGVTLAQGRDGSAPQYPGMPDSAIASGAVDLAIPVEAMPERILAIQRSRTTPDAAARRRTLEQQIASVRLEVCRLLHAQLGHDFSQYKEPTFLRRVQRRMQVVGLAPGAYVERLRQDPTEATLLFRDLLIGVTSFFRDTATFRAVEETVLPRLFGRKDAGNGLRIWVPGCATGEEAYSLAIMVREYLDGTNSPMRVQIFATDIDEPAIGVARAGRYPAILLRDVPEARLARFFTQVDSTYIVNKSVRELCTFSTHSLIRDPPFSRIDLISCRNLLIYLDVELQAQVIPAFHYALATDGLLLLGGSETVARHGDLFAPIDAKHRIFQRRDVVSPPLQVSAMVSPGRLPEPVRSLTADLSPDRARALQFANARIRDRFAPAYALVNADGEAIHYSPRTGKYLELPAGAPTRNLVAMARRGLRIELRAALRRALETGRAVEQEHVGIELEGGAQDITLTVEPVPGTDENRLFMVVFTDEGRTRARDEPPADGRASLADDATIEQLDRELRDLREQNQSTREEYETALEELKSANEELHSVNEELQSSNEELETSKEEIQSMNEELQTVNAQLASKVDELDRASNDLRNVFESTQVATIFLDRNLIVRGFTPAVGGIYNLIPSDHGRPLTDIASQLDYSELMQDLEHVLHRLTPLERRVTRRGGDTHYLMRILPYRANDNGVEGALITFVDVSNIVRAEQHHRLLVDELNHRVKNMLTVVISLASQTLRRADDLEGFSKAFLGRLHALSGAYTLLTRDNWTDVPLQDVMFEELGPFMGKDEANISMEGPEVFLRPKGAMAVGLAIHELATNAVKYGALSMPEGRVTIQWNITREPDLGQLRWSWVERGGPAVEEPTRRGFGLSLIERSVAHELNGCAEIRFTPSGLEAVLTAPLDPATVLGTGSHDDASQEIA